VPDFVVSDDVPVLGEDDDGTWSYVARRWAEFGQQLVVLTAPAQQIVPATELRFETIETDESVAVLTSDDDFYSGDDLW